MKRREMVVVDCPREPREVGEDVRRSKEYEMLWKVVDRCDKCLLMAGLDRGRLFRLEHDVGTGISWYLQCDDLDVDEESIQIAMDHLCKSEGSRSLDYLNPTLTNLVRGLDEACAVTTRIKIAAEDAAGAAIRGLPRVPVILKREEALHRLMVGGSGPLELRGPTTRDGIDELIARVHARSPWLRRATERIWHLLIARMKRSDRAGIQMPPVLLYGPPGTGKTQLAASLACEAGTEHIEIDAAAGSSGFRIAGVEAGWSSRQIGEPLRLIAETRCPNPVVVINEIDKTGAGMSSTSGSSTSMTNALLPLLDEESAKTFRCPVTGLVCDMSGIVWIMTANDLEGILEPLRTRCEIIEVPALTMEDFMEAAEVMIGADDPLALHAVQRLIEVSHGSPGFSLRHVARSVERLLAIDGEARQFH